MKKIVLISLLGKNTNLYYAAGIANAVAKTQEV